MKQFSKLPLGHQVASAVAIVSLCVIGSLAWLIASLAGREMLRNQHESLSAQLQVAGTLFELGYGVAVSQTERQAGAFAGRFPYPLERDTARTIQIAGQDTPLLLHAGKQLNLDTSEVDGFARDTGALATIFVLKGEDYIRISTNVKNEAGERAVGTTLDRAHPAYAALQAKRNYSGPAILFGKQYVTHYQPIMDENGQNLGALYVGVESTRWFDQIGKDIGKLRIGDSGYLFAVQTQGAKRGTLLVHPELVGKSILDTEDASGAKPFAAIMENQSGTLHYPWKDQDGRVREKTLLYHGTPAWGGIAVAGGTFDDELTRGADRMRLLILGLGAVGALGLAALMSFLLGRELKPVSTLAKILAQAGEGDLTADRGLPPAETDSRNELHQMRHQVSQMLTRFRALMTQVRREAGSVSETAHDLHSTASELAKAAEVQSGAASAIAASVEQMAVSVSMVNDNASKSNEITRTAQRLCGESEGTVQEATQAMQQIETAVAEASALIDRLGADSQRISQVVALIKDVADQTNLLALNAAIEAARAGEQGRGFAVVADEVRKLAERTSLSTVEIETIINAIHAGTESAIESMRRAGQMVDQGTRQFWSVGETVQQISTGTHEAADIATEISHALREQSAAANNIGQEVEKVSVLSEETSRAADEARQSAQRMATLAGGLRDALARFRTD